MKWLKSDNYSLPAILAIGLHAIIILIGIITVNFSDSEKPEPKRPVIVNAKVIDISETVIGKQEAKERAAKQQALANAAKKKKESERKKQQAERKALEDKKKKLAQAKQAKEKAAKVAEQKAKQQKRAAEQKRIAEKIARDKRLAEQERADQAAEKKRQTEAAEQKRLAEKGAEDKKHKEQELLAKAEAERIAEEKRKRQEEASRIAEEKRKAEETAAAIAAAEKARQEAADEAQMVQSISGLINSRVASAWNRPPNARNGMKAQLRIEFLPNGEILDAHITQSSGDALFDQRTLDAVFKVEKIEELANIDIVSFERNFRRVDLIFNPQDLRN